MLGCFRDACRRFAVDTDRVFLTGHAIGGDAAWDIGLAHPDLWAGVIPVVAESDRFCALYWENAQNVPFYFVCGELDGNRMTENARDLDRYLQHGYNTTVVEYLGRGHEHFSDEILRLFDWMGRFHRDFFPREFTCATMRRVGQFLLVGRTGRRCRRGPSSNPSEWPPPRNLQPVQVKANVDRQQQPLDFRPGPAAVTVWLAAGNARFQTPDEHPRQRPEDEQPLHRTWRPTWTRCLEDVRTRGDRQHPFWAKFECTTGRRRVERAVRGQGPGTRDWKSPATVLRGPDVAGRLRFRLPNFAFRIPNSRPACIFPRPDYLGCVWSLPGGLDREPNPRPILAGRSHAQ